jgi:putative endopeptidase
MRRLPSLGVVAAATVTFVAAMCVSAAEKPSLADVAPWGVALGDMDGTIAPGDDFYRYTSGAWLSRVTFGPGEVRVGSRETVRDRVKSRIAEILKDLSDPTRARTPDEARLGDFFASYIDVAGREKRGIEPLRPLLKAQRSVSTAADVAAAFGAAARRGHTAPLLTDVSFDYKNTERVILRIAVEGLALPGPDYYLRDEDRYKAARAAYATYIVALLKVAGVSATPQTAELVVDFERRIASHHWSGADRRDLSKITTIYRREDLARAFPGIDWDAYLNAAGYGPVVELVVQHPSATGPVVKEIAATPVAVVRDYLMVQLTASYADYLSAEVAAANAVLQSVLSGQTGAEVIEKRAIAVVEAGMSEALGRAYVARYFSAPAREAAADLVDRVRAELRDRLAHVAWMADDTRREALAKIDRLNVKIGYPERWLDYSALRIARDDLVGNVARLREWRVAQEAGRLTRPAERWRWFLPAHSTNAAYNPAFNEIILPAGILQAPFFDPNADAAVNFGAIGGVIGHELSHGFDDIGRRLDAKGQLRDWWTPEDAARFTREAEKLVRQYGAYEYAPGYRVHGRLTLGENLADVNGLSLAYVAYRRSLNGREPAVLDGFTGDQRFFLGWAQMRRAKDRPEFLIARMPSSPHAPDEFRVNGVVRNLESWHAAFDVGPRRRLYLAEGERVSLW